MELKQDVDDRRTGVRLNFKVLVSVFPEHSNQTYQGWSENVSISGIALQAEVPSSFLNTPCSVSIHFPGSHSNLVIQDLKGRIIRVEDDHTAITFDNPLEWFLLFPVYQRKLSSADSGNSAQ